MTLSVDWALSINSYKHNLCDVIAYIVFIYKTKSPITTKLL